MATSAFLLRYSRTYEKTTLLGNQHRARPFLVGASLSKATQGLV
jgi:hypothetical protein